MIKTDIAVSTTTIHQMGVYFINIGKGIIVPVKRFVKIFLKQILEAAPEEGGEDKIMMDPEEFFTTIVKDNISRSLSVKILGHDAFTGREGKYTSMDVLDRTDNQDALVLVEKWLKEPAGGVYPFHLPLLGDLLFIGRSKELKPEFSYRIEAPEVIYGLPALLPELCEYYMIWRDKPLPKLQRSKLAGKQKVAIWTFATDCCCCT